MSARRSLLAAALALGVAGCAVTKIDVDVYKGPLSNQEDIRAQQFVVLASAAKPFLVRLRDTLERQEPGAAQSFEPDYVPNYRWRSLKAERVNAILSLYKDLTERELEKFAAEVLPTYRTYEDAIAALEYRRDPGLWSRVAKDIKADQRDSALAKAYRRLLDGSYEPKEFRRAALLRDLRSTGAKDSHVIDNFFIHLESSSSVQTDAQALFEDPGGTSAQQFVAGALVYARSFREARESLHTIWTTANNALIELDQLPLPQAAEQQEKRNRLKRGLAALIGQTTQAEYANYALCQTGAPAGFTTLRSQLQADALGAFWSSTTGRWDNAAWQRARNAIELRLRADPQGTAQTLLDADRRLRADPRSC